MSCGIGRGALFAPAGDQARMPACGVHVHGRGLIGAEQTKGHQEHVHQAGVIGVLDVLEHQLPIARDTLPHIAEEPQRTPIEHTVEIRQHGRAKVVCEWFDLRAKTGKDGAVTDRDLESLKPIRLAGEIGRHATLMLEATVERHPAQAPLEVVGPLMVRAGEPLHIPRWHTAKLDAAMRTAVDEDVHSPCLVTHQHHWPIANRHLLEIPRLRDFHLQADVGPALPTEDTAHLLLVDLGIGVGPERHPCHTFRRPMTVEGCRGCCSRHLHLLSDLL